MYLFSRSCSFCHYPKNARFFCCYRDIQRGLPTPEIIEQEILQWKLKWSSVPENERSQTCATAIKSCSSIAFPNIYTLLKIACTLPVTSCECERSASVILRPDNYMRHCMPTEERSIVLALLHIHYDTNVDMEEVVKMFAHMHPR